MKTIRLITTLLLMAMTVSMSAQSESVKQQKLRRTRAELKDEASRLAQKEAKRLIKEDWQVSPLSLIHI